MVERGLSAHNKLFCEGNMGKLVFIKRTDQRPEERLRLKELGVSQNKTQGTRLLSSLLTAAHGGNEAESRETAGRQRSFLPITKSPQDQTGWSYFGKVLGRTKNRPKRFAKLFGYYLEF